MTGMSLPEDPAAEAGPIDGAGSAVYEWTVFGQRVPILVTADGRIFVNGDEVREWTDELHARKSV